MYITMWVAKKEKHTWMIEEKLDDFCRFDWNTVDLLTIKIIIYNFWVHNVANVLQGKQICSDFLDICQVFKLLAKRIAILVREMYNEKWLEYFQARKEKNRI